MADSLVVFTPSGKRGRFPRGTTVLAAARRLGVDIDSVCGGRAICGRCQVTVSEGEFAKFAIASRARHLTQPNAAEQGYAQAKPRAAGRRVSCCAELAGECVIDVPPDSQVPRQIVRKRAEAR
ncbi:MAG: 2Fe-2S iron-sulfur cluster-binding protein, partial [Rhodospirillales bacterium]